VGVSLIKAWFEAGASPSDLLDQATQPGNKSYELVGYIEKAQKDIKQAIAEQPSLTKEEPMIIEGGFTVKAPIQKLWGDAAAARNIGCVPARRRKVER
jgi:hypothetical protein